MNTDPDNLAPAVPPPGTERPPCSAKGCHTPAQWALHWNNPRLHAADRRKTWLACDDHREGLAAFLDARRFLRDTLPLDAAQPDHP